YQRTFAMSVLGVLMIGLLSGSLRGPTLSLLALPMAVGGLGVAGFHVYLETTGALECPKGILDIGSAPQQSLAAFVVLAIPLFLDIMAICCRPASDSGSSRGTALTVAALVLGGLFATGCIMSAP